MEKIMYRKFEPLYMIRLWASLLISYFDLCCYMKPAFDVGVIIMFKHNIGFNDIAHHHVVLDNTDSWKQGSIHCTLIAELQSCWGFFQTRGNCERNFFSSNTLPPSPPSLLAKGLLPPLANEDAPPPYL